MSYEYRLEVKFNWQKHWAIGAVEPEGSEQHLAYLARKYQKDGHKVRVSRRKVGEWEKCNLEEIIGGRENEMSSKAREALEELCAVDFGKLMFPLDGDSSVIYNSDKKEITTAYWYIAEVLNQVKRVQDKAKSALAEQKYEAKWELGAEHECAYCSHCGHQQWASWDSYREAVENIGEFHKEYKFCPNCGFEMKGVNDEQ